MIHPGARNLWIAALLTLIGSIQFGGGLVLTATGIMGESIALVPGLALLGAGSMIIWILLGTSYEITQDSLILRSGPVRWTIPLQALTSVIPTPGGSTLIEWNLGLGLRGVRIRYRKPSGGITWPIRITPEDRAAFLLEISTMRPDMHIGEDGSLRDPTQAKPG